MWKMTKISAKGMPLFAQNAFCLNKFIYVKIPPVPRDSSGLPCAVCRQYTVITKHTTKPYSTAQAAKVQHAKLCHGTEQYAAPQSVAKHCKAQQYKALQNIAKHCSALHCAGEQSIAKHSTAKHSA